ncbi:Thiosulfate sulfurtransferase GlpE [uncultured archaeon]|nr:Thiosulfate sulfurtransferase GlpE [uncultured archaeon]
MKSVSVSFAVLLSVFALGALASAQAAGPKVTVVGNSIDLPPVQGFLDNLATAGVTVTAVSAQDFAPHKNDSLIFILGGQNAPEGVGDLVSGLLTQSEKDELMSRWDARTIVILPNVWAAKQKVIIFAGHEKEQTRLLFGETQGDILKTLKFNDSALPDNYTASIVPVPPTDPSQPFTEVDPYQANSIIKTIPGITAIDVRGKEFYAVGHIPGAINIPVRDLPLAMKSLDKNGTYILNCGGNSESIKAGNMMAAEGFTKIYRLVDGYMAWRKAGFPREKSA